ncbi:hypothetical protein K501DRAFT_276272 [Backusella circina FSU 941]|nr:hypothetical protein K501DRAFT_276272 [Backusella circina FSU 941]
MRKYNRGGKSGLNYYFTSFIFFWDIIVEYNAVFKSCSLAGRVCVTSCLEALTLHWQIKSRGVALVQSARIKQFIQVICTSTDFQNAKSLHINSHKKAMLFTIVSTFGQNIALGSLIAYCVLMVQSIYCYIRDPSKERNNKTRFSSLCAALFGVLSAGVSFGLLNGSMSSIDTENAYPLSIVFYGASYSTTWLTEIYAFSRIAKGYRELDFARFKRLGQICISLGYLWSVIVFLHSIICAIFFGLEADINSIYSSKITSVFLVLLYMPWAFILIYSGLLYSFSTLIQPGIGYWTLFVFLILNSIPILMNTIYSLGTYPFVSGNQGGGILLLILTDVLTVISLGMVNFYDKFCIYKEPEHYNFDA